MCEMHSFELLLRAIPLGRVTENLRCGALVTCLPLLGCCSDGKPYI